MYRCNAQSHCVEYAKSALQFSIEKLSHGNRQMQFVSSKLSQTIRNETHCNSFRTFSSHTNCSNTFFKKRHLKLTSTAKNYGMLTRNFFTIFNNPSYSHLLNQIYNHSNITCKQNHLGLLSNFSTAAPRSRKNANDNKPLINEKLVQQLRRLQKRKGKPSNVTDTSNDDIEVRVVMDVPKDSNDEESNNDRSKAPPIVSILPLSTAVKNAQQLSLDLVEINLGQTPPIIRATDYAKLVYDQKKKKRSLKDKGGGNKKLQTKEYKFNAGISEHDLERKVKNLESYLQKGHSCKVTITAKNFVFRQNRNAVMDTLERVQFFIKDQISEGAKIRQTSERRLSVTYQPKKQ